MQHKRLRVEEPIMLGMNRVSQPGDTRDITRDTFEQIVHPTQVSIAALT